MDEDSNGEYWDNEASEAIKIEDYDRRPTKNSNMDISKNTNNRLSGNDLV